MTRYIVRETFTVKYYIDAETETEALEKAESIGPREFDEIDQEAPLPPMTAEVDPEA